ncbi:melatonin receptor type 1B-B-like [Oculina patagonica]
MEEGVGELDLPHRSHATAALESMTVVVFAILSIFGNTLIIAAFFRIKSLRTIPNLLVVNLSIADVLSAITAHPLLASVLIRGGWYLGHEACKFQAILNSFLCTTSHLSITFITLNRYLIVVRYRKYTNTFTKRSTRVFLLAIWVLSFFLALTHIMAQEEAEFHAKEAVCVISKRNSASSVLIVVFGNIVFLATIYFNYAIFRLVRLHRKQVSASLPAKSGVSPAGRRANWRSTAVGTRGILANRNEEFYIARKVLIVTTLYTLCWLPQGILKNASLANKDFSREMWMTSTFSMQLSSVLNPVLYGLLNRKLRKTVLWMLGIKAKQLIQIATTEVSTKRFQMTRLKGAFVVNRASN